MYVVMSMCLLKDYVARLEQSIPLWEMFNKQKEYLSNWVTESQALYDGDALRPGNALVTRNSLNNAEVHHNTLLFTSFIQYKSMHVHRVDQLDSSSK